MGERSRFKQISWLLVAGRGPMAPLQPPGTPLSEQGESAVCQDCSYHLGAPTGAFCSALMAVLSPVPYPPQPHSSFLSAEPCASLGERRNPPPRPRTVESCLVRHYWGARALSCPYQSQGQSVWLACGGGSTAGWHPPSPPALETRHPLQKKPSALSPRLWSASGGPSAPGPELTGSLQPQP